MKEKHDADAPCLELRIEQAETRAEQANKRTVQADLRTEKSEARGEAMRASEVSYRRLFESARDGILILDAVTGRITEVNPYLVELLGFPRGEIVGKTVGELSPFKDVVANQDILERLQKGGYVRYEDLPLETRDGRRISVEFVSNVYLAGDKEVIQCNIRDITKRKQHEHEITRLSRLYLALSQINQVVFSTTDRDEMFGKICRVLVERAGFSMAWIGLTDAETRRVNLISQWGDGNGYLPEAAIYADDRPEGRGPTGMAIREGKTYVCNDFVCDPNTVPWREPAGRVGFRASAGFPIRQGGVVCGALTIYSSEIGFFQNKEIVLLEEAAEDISFALDNLVKESVRRRSETALRESEQSYRGLFEHMSGGIAYCRVIYEEGMAKDFVYLEVNPSFTSLTGLKEVIGKPASEVIPGLREKDPELIEIYGRVAATGQPERFERFVVALQQWFDLSVYSTKPGFFVAVFDLITERKRLEAQFIEAQKMEVVGQLAGGVAHDFNNILAVIIGYSDLIMADLGADSPQRKYVEEIRHASDRAAGLTRQLLVFSRKQTVQPVVLDLNEVVHDLEKMLRRLLDENIEMATVPEIQIGHVKADPGYVGQLLMNLVVNARDAMPNGGKITITTSNVTLDEAHARAHPGAMSGDHVMLSVQDTGTGMTDEVKAHLFEAFFTTKPVGKGTGLGLATCQTIIQQCAGHIGVHSELGKGTTFKIWFPRVDEPVDTNTKFITAGPLPQGTETLLVVEDDPSVRHLARGVLEKQGYQVLSATNGQDGLHVARAHRGSPICLVVTDVIMPQMGGKVMAEWLKETYPHLKVLFTSGYTDDSISHHGVMDAGVQFLGKPYSPATLARKVREMLDKN